MPPTPTTAPWPTDALGFPMAFRLAVPGRAAAPDHVRATLTLVEVTADVVANGPAALPGPHSQAEGGR